MRHTGFTRWFSKRDGSPSRLHGNAIELPGTLVTARQQAGKVWSGQFRKALSPRQGASKCVIVGTLTYFAGHNVPGAILAGLTAGACALVLLNRELP